MNFYSRRTKQFYLIDNTNCKRCIKSKGQQNLRNVRKKYYSILQNYCFTKNKIKIAIQAQGSYTIDQIRIKQNIYLTSLQYNEYQQPFTLILKDLPLNKQTTIYIKTNPQQLLNKFRQRQKIGMEFKFFYKNNQISQGSEEKYKIEDIVYKGEIIVVKKISTEEKMKQYKEIQSKKNKIQQEYKEKMTQLNDIKKWLQKRDVVQNDRDRVLMVRQNEGANQQLNMKLSQLGGPFQFLNQLTHTISNKVFISSLQKLLTQKQKASNEVLSYINRTLKTFSQNLQENGYIIRSLYKRKVQIHQKTNVIDFQNSIITNYNGQTELKYFNAIVYNSQKQYDVLEKFKNAEAYCFKGGEIKAGGGVKDSEYGVALDVDGSVVSLSNSQEAKATRGVATSQTISQIFSAYCCNYVISWNQNDIKLKTRVIQEFDQIINQYKAKKAVPQLGWLSWIYHIIQLKYQQYCGINHEQQQKKKQQQIQTWLNQQLQAFLNKYGEFIQTGKYYLGGFYRNTMNYAFSQGKNANELTSILNSHTQLSISGGMSFNGWILNGKAGYNQENKNLEQQKCGQNAFTESQGYSITYSHQSNTLQNVENLKDWCDLMKQFPYDWKLIKVQDKSQVSIARLLRLNKNNSINKTKLQGQFLEVQEKLDKIIAKRAQSYEQFLAIQQQRQKQRQQQLKMIQLSKKNLEQQIAQQTQQQQKFQQLLTEQRLQSISKRQLFLFKINNIKLSKCYILTQNNLIKLNGYDNYVVKSDRNVPKNRVSVVQMKVSNSSTWKINVGVMVTGIGSIEYRFQDNVICYVMRNDTSKGKDANLIKKDKNSQHRNSTNTPNPYFSLQTQTSLLQTQNQNNAALSCEPQDYTIKTIPIQNYCYKKGDTLQMIIDLNNLKMGFQFNKGEYSRQVNLPAKFLLHDVRVFFQILQEGGIIDIGKNLICG